MAADASQTTHLSRCVVAGGLPAATASTSRAVITYAEVASWQQIGEL
jgi:hypothetical protein